jgi:hypothetical protein
MHLLDLAIVVAYLAGTARSAGGSPAASAEP